MFRSWKGRNGRRALGATSRRRLARGTHSASRRAWLARHGGRRPEPEAAAPEPRKDAGTFPITISADSDVGPDARERATELIVGVARFAPRRVLDARATIRIHDDPALERPVEVGGSLDVGGRVVRAHAAAARLADALDLLEARLRRNLEDVDGRWRTRRRPR